MTSWPRPARKIVAEAARCGADLSGPWGSIKTTLRQPDASFAEGLSISGDRVAEGLPCVPCDVWRWLKGMLSFKESPTQWDAQCVEVKLSVQPVLHVPLAVDSTLHERFSTCLLGA